MSARSAYRRRASRSVFLALFPALFLIPSGVRADSQVAVESLQRSGEVEVLGDRGTQISVDGQPAQGLPLSAPLLLPAGEHVITATQGQTTLRSQITVRAGRALEVRFNFDVQAVSIAVPPHALLLERYEGITPEAVQELAVTTVRALSKQRLTLLLPAASAQLPKDCLQQLPCLLDQAKQHETEYAVVVAVAANKASDADSAPGYSIRGQIVDRSVQAEASVVSESCDSCNIGQLNEKLRMVFTELAVRALSRKKGVLHVKSDPPQADIFANGVRLGTTPFQRARWATSVDLKATLPGHQPIEKHVLIREDAETTVELQLPTTEPEEIRKRRVIVLGNEAKVLRQPRPRWRLYAGGIGLGVGGLLLGFGSGALSVDGKCITEAMGAARHCDQLYATFPVGTGLVTTGAVLAVGGTLMMLWPGPVVPAPSPISLLTGDR